MTDHEKSRVSPALEAKDVADAALEQLFEAAQKNAPLPSGDLMARILADAAAEQAKNQAQEAPRRAAPSPVLGLRAALGGWAGLSGLAGAVALGLMIGIFPPDGLTSYTDLVLGSGSTGLSDYLPGLEGVSIDG